MLVRRTIWIKQKEYEVTCKWEPLQASTKGQMCARFAEIVCAPENWACGRHKRV